MTDIRIFISQSIFTADFLFRNQIIVNKNRLIVTIIYLFFHLPTKNYKRSPPTKIRDGAAKLTVSLYVEKILC